MITEGTGGRDGGGANSPASGAGGSRTRNRIKYSNKEISSFDTAAVAPGAGSLL